MENDYENIFLEEENCADVLSDIPDDYDHSDTGDSASESGSDNNFSTRRRPRVLRVVYSDSEEEHDVESDWNDDDPPRNNLPFEGNPGLPFNLDKKNIDDIVSLFIGDDLLQTISSETNRYYHQNSNAHKLPKKTKKWYDVTVPELKIWLGLVIIMGLVKKSKLSDYWSTNPFIETPIFSKTMPRNRFFQILKFLHFVNNEDIQINSSRLSKVQTIIDYFSEKFKEIYKPKQNLSLDEGMIPWRGRLKMKVYNPSKITKYGILVRMVCDSITGYICGFKLYSGVGVPLKDTIMDLIAPHLHKNLKKRSMFFPHFIKMPPVTGHRFIAKLPGR